ncbi:MAG: zinc-dependent peptidase [Cryobacterium sp.]|nr:zinc-dependent peptidase [Oligoflexia bacterium]
MIRALAERSVERNFALFAIALTLALGTFFTLWMIARSKKNRTARIRESLRRDGFPGVYEKMLAESFRPYSFLDASEKASLQEKILAFLEEKNFHGINDFEVTDEMKVLVAAEACLLILKSESESLFPGLSNIYLVEDAYVPRENPLNPATGRPTAGPRLGESWKRGPIVLSWAAVKSSLNGSSGNQNVVAHEFSHQLDQQDGKFDGTPELGPQGNLGRWVTVMSREFLELRAELSAHRSSRAVGGGYGHEPSREFGGGNIGSSDISSEDIDPYAATNEAEFFAVLTEYFFMNPRSLLKKHPELFGILRSYFGLDPARWAKR